MKQQTHLITKRNEKRIHSQNGEDGIIDCIFAAIGTTNKVAVEIGVSVTAKDKHGNYISTRLENNTAALAEKDWKLYWFDIIDPFVTPKNCTFTNKFLTKDNIVGCFEQNGIPKEFDLLSIDIDSNDYYLRDALRGYSPRVVISEYNGCFDGSVEHIMPYNENYIWPGESDRDYGASLKSLTKQADDLGYDLVYCEKNGVNAFFIRKDINVFKPQTSEEAWVKLWWTRRTRDRETLNNVYSSTLQRICTDDEYETYKDVDIEQVRDILFNTSEYRTLNSEKLRITSPQITFPYTIISVNDRASDNTKRTKSIIPTEFIDDIEFVDGNKTDMQAYFDNNGIKITWDEVASDRKPLPGELGCAASHLNCLKYMVDNNIPNMLVLEDDAIPVENFLSILNNCYNDLPEDYDFLANMEQIYVGELFVKTVADPILIGSQFISKSYLLNSVTKFMLYSYSGAKKILEAYKTYGIYCPIDLFLYDMSRDHVLNGYSTFFGNTLVDPRNQYGSMIDPADVRGNRASMADLPWAQDKEKFNGVLALYESLLGRPADRTGAHYYVTSDFTLREIKNILLNSDEYAERRKTERQ